MLSRVARRRAALRHLERASEPLVAPWLCPALLRSQSHPNRVGSLSKAAASTTLAGEPQQRRAPQRFTALKQQSARNLATATDHYEPHGSSYIPFERPAGLYNPVTGQSMSPHSQFQPPSPSPQGLPDFDPSSLIVIDHSLMTRPKVHRRINNIGGDEAEMGADLVVSLSVGMFDRAAGLIRRLCPTPKADPERYLELHNKFLSGVVSRILVSRKGGMVWSLFKYFEVNMQHGDVKPDATSYALMIRVALRLLHGSRRDRTVRRYWSLAKEREIEEEVLALPILSEMELGELSQICSADLHGAALGDLDVDLSTPSNDSATVFNEATETPQVLDTAQTGSGLDAVKSSLSLFNSDTQIPYPSHLSGTQAEKDEVYAELRQRRLEADAVQAAMERWRKDHESAKQGERVIKGPAHKLGPLLWEWHQQLGEKLRLELDAMTNKGKKTEQGQVDANRASYVAYLRSLEVDQLAAITILSAFTVMNTNGIEKGTKLGTLVLRIGQAVQEEVSAKEIRSSSKSRQDPRYRSFVLDKILAHRTTKQGRQAWSKFCEKHKESLPDTFWPPGTEAGVGAILVSLLLDVAKVRVEKEHPENGQKFVSLQSAYQYTYQLERGRRIGYVHMNSAIAEKLRVEPIGDLISKHLPMVSKPKPWKGLADGGFITQKIPVVRVKGGDQAQYSYARAAIKRGDLDQMFAGLDVLGKTGWKINKQVFDVMLEAWNSGEQIANLAPNYFHVELPEKPSEDDKEARKRWFNLKKSLNNKKGGLHSERCFQNFQMEIARAFRNETFYLPHNMDFRGRAYPIPPYLNQMGADNCRGLLMFSDGKPLGERGLRWLKIHLANVFGYDKASLQERVDFTMDHLDDVLDSANNGLHGKKWWLKAEDPWQCLSACIELRNALACPDPTQFVSRLPIHQDGSCNGLQHYAALGGDVMGARQVNLEPSDRPSDVYTGVSDFVKADIKKEAAEGVEIAKILDGKITRKVVKQTVMTNVYGVTFLGAIRQVRRQLEDYNPELKDSAYSIPICATYIARKIFKALGSIFSGAHHIQYWLGDCAGRISQSLTPEQVTQIINDPELSSKTERQRRSLKKDKDPLSKFNSTVIWTTPLKLPVVQPYRETKSRRVKTSLQDINVRDPHVTDAVNKRKQLQAFPPNFIHSLDATHMLLSANKCHELGLVFSAVHDSFWTHAGDVDTMNTVLRDEFVRMHSEDIMKRLAMEFNIRYSKNIFLAQLKRDSPVAKAILAHRKKTKTNSRSGVSKLSELALEHKRLTLLRSESPEEQAEGRAMITPASIFERFSDAEDALNTKQSLGETAIGHVPENIESAEPGTSALDQLSDQLDLSQGEFGESEDSDLDAPVAETAASAETASKPAGTKKRAPKTPIWVWLPLTFRTVPEKGDFDVARLKGSEYFFC